MEPPPADNVHTSTIASSPGPSPSWLTSTNETTPLLPEGASQYVTRVLLLGCARDRMWSHDSKRRSFYRLYMYQRLLLLSDKLTVVILNVSLLSYSQWLYSVRHGFKRQWLQLFQLFQGVPAGHSRGCQPHCPGECQRRRVGVISQYRQIFGCYFSAFLVLYFLPVTLSLSNTAQ